MTAISTTLHETTFVLCSAQEAHRYLVTHFAPRNGVAPTILVRVPLADLALDHPVAVSLADLPSKAGEYVMEVSWSAEHGGPYPTFIGSLACLPGGSTSSHLEIEGAYTIPGGVVGQAFDAAIGHRIAESAVKSLLVALRGVIEAAHENELAAHAAKAAPTYPPTYE